MYRTNEQRRREDAEKAETESTNYNMFAHHMGSGDVATAGNFINLGYLELQSKFDNARSWWSYNEVLQAADKFLKTYKSGNAKGYKSIHDFAGKISILRQQAENKRDNFYINQAEERKLAENKKKMEEEQKEKDDKLRIQQEIDAAQQNYAASRPNEQNIASALQSRAETINQIQIINPINQQLGLAQIALPNSDVHGQTLVADAKNKKLIDYNNELNLLQQQFNQSTLLPTLSAQQAEAARLIVGANELVNKMNSIGNNIGYNNAMSLYDDLSKKYNKLSNDINVQNEEKKFFDKIDEGIKAFNKQNEYYLTQKKKQAEDFLEQQKNQSAQQSAIRMHMNELFGQNNQNPKEMMQKQLMQQLKSLHRSGEGQIKYVRVPKKPSIEEIIMREFEDDDGQDNEVNFDF